MGGEEEGAAAAAKERLPWADEAATAGETGALGGGWMMHLRRRVPAVDLSMVDE